MTRPSRKNYHYHSLIEQQLSPQNIHRKQHRLKDTKKSLRTNQSGLETDASSMPSPVSRPSMWHRILSVVSRAGFLYKCGFNPMPRPSSTSHIANLLNKFIVASKSLFSARSQSSASGAQVPVCNSSKVLHCHHQSDSYQFIPKEAGGKTQEKLSCFSIIRTI